MFWVTLNPDYLLIHLVGNDVRVINGLYSKFNASGHLVRVSLALLS
uniref:Uncharacterized protein n=1 Tax=Anguilla anguilla TaxID=7936 RepID=A0A0E9WJD8_ANGAN